tara:strand:- start:12153 stop:12440 length:288 start_codon:yes stop_codon:yes gene_type:complete
VWRLNDTQIGAKPILLGGKNMLSVADKMITTDRATIPIDRLQHVSYQYLTNIDGKKEVEVKLYTAHPSVVIQTCSAKSLEDFLHFLKLEKMGLSD